MNASKLTQTYGIPGIYLKLMQTLKNQLQLYHLLVKMNILVWDPTFVWISMEYGDMAVNCSGKQLDNQW